MPPDIETAREWMQLSQEDLNAAKLLFSQKAPLLQTGFHCQQAVEEALKVVLVLNRQRPPHTHNLADLFGLAARWIPELLQHEPQCTWLTTFAVETRYPGSGQPVTSDMATRAKAAAQALFDFVRASVPAEVRP
ncbi:MAG TPA: HEPN domain-containing protein [Phycisphaerae bacterium]|nr:HEPN domain-containing protein [Phycisphaerae bacterium]